MPTPSLPSRSPLLLGATLLVLVSVACSAEARPPADRAVPTNTRTAASLGQFQKMADEVTVRLAGCIEDRGIEVKPFDESMALTIDFAEQEIDHEALNAAIATCKERHPYPAPPALTRAQLDALHTRLLGRADCLEEHGHPPIQRPDANSFAATMGPFLVSGAGEGWEPLDAKAVPDDIDLAQLQKTCPSPRLGDLPGA